MSGNSVSDAVLLDLVDVETAENVYKKVWEEFHTWNLNSAKSTLDDLQNTTELQAHTFDRGHHYDASDEERPFEHRGAGLQGQNNLREGTLEEIVLWLPSFEEITFTFSRVSIAANVQSYPVYESCTPSNQNFGPHKESPEETDYLCFFPYADDKDFNFVLYSSHFNAHAWQSGDVDPNAELINLETLCRVHDTTDVPLQDIDGLNFLPKMRESAQDGFIWRICQRDTVYSQLNKGLLCSADHKKTFSDEIGRLSVHIQSFCANLNCLHSLCRTHTSLESGSNMQIIVESTLKSLDLLNAERNPCGEDCYLILDDETTDTVDPDEALINVLRAILAVCPDIIPCKLVRACRRPCYQIFLQRRKLLVDDNIVNSIPIQESRRRDVPFLDDDYDGTAMFKPPEPCHHRGQCEENEHCSCWMSSIRCQRYCHFGKKCNTRWRGCKCKLHNTDKNGVCCYDDTCECYATGRECDPELCRSCGASVPKKKRSTSRKPCRNTQLQDGVRKAVDIRSASYGLGAYSLEAVAPHALIGEYVGAQVTGDEIGYEDRFLYTSHIRKFHNDYRKRNYMFDLNESTYLDAVGISNEMRFPNHDRNNNCYPLRRYVNGQHRIGIYAKKAIAKHDEFLLDYGDWFFTGT